MELIVHLVNFILHIDKHLAEFIANYGAWTYAILFAIIFFETGVVVTPILPGDSLLFAAGALASSTMLDVHFMVLLLIVAAVLGDALNYTIGHWLGPKVFHYEDSRFFKKVYLEKTHAFYEKYGGKTIIIARFIPIIRTFAPFVAGIGRMGYGKFFSYNVIGAILWVVSVTYVGYFFGNLPKVHSNFTLIIMAIIIVSVIPVVVETTRHWLANKKTIK